MPQVNIEEITSTDLANYTGEVLNRICYGRRPTIVSRRGKPLVVIVDVETWDELTNENENDTGDRCAH